MAERPWACAARAIMGTLSTLMAVRSQSMKRQSAPLAASASTTGME